MEVGSSRLVEWQQVAPEDLMGWAGKGVTWRQTRGDELGAQRYRVGVGKSGDCRFHLRG